MDKSIINSNILILFVSFLFILISCISNTDQTNNREYNLFSQLMCPICDGQTIAESQASIAEDMKKMIRDQIKDGRSDKEILKYFEERYGQEILSSPIPRGFNLTIWIAPILLIIISLIMTIYYLRKNMGKRSNYDSF
ncbi:MAG: cytochrome c-type biogenesis protein CcmH [Chloroflexota bacterium]|nr:cytochrome c-type biogenesis protein CcmH [Chloroflexota bacterium]|tara:strand:- start:733 stop:1146 length:414 start_codon:yes stop_codon:yes gene_type:complete